MSLESRPGSSSTASARERHQPPTSARRQRASRAAPLAALGRPGVCHWPLRPTPGAGWGGIGVSRSTLTGSLSAAAAMVGVEPSSSAAAAAAAAAVEPLAAARAARRRRRAAARRSATRPSSGLQVGMWWLGRLQRRLAYVRRPCRCSALVRVRICSCSRRTGRQCRVCMSCVCRHAAGSRQMGADAAACGRAGCSPAGFDACAYQKYDFNFLKLTRLIAATVTQNTA